MSLHIESENHGISFEIYSAEGNSCPFRDIAINVLSIYIGNSPSR